MIEKNRYIINQKQRFNEKGGFIDSEIDLLIGNPSISMNKLGWKPKYSFCLVKEIVTADIELFVKDELLMNAGYAIKNQFE